MSYFFIILDVQNLKKKSYFYLDFINLLITTNTNWIFVPTNTKETKQTCLLNIFEIQFETL